MKIPRELKGVVTDDVRKELDHLHKTGIPRCLKCHKDYVHAVNSKTGELSEYLWKPVCDCIKKPVMISLG
jgi:hypothetical protein